jgi:hypothetical protein
MSDGATIEEAIANGREAFRETRIAEAECRGRPVASTVAKNALREAYRASRT